MQYFSEKVEFGKEIYNLQKINMSDSKVLSYIEEFFSDDVTATSTQRKNRNVDYVPFKVNS